MEEKLKIWKKPELIMHGNLDMITQTKNKTFGSGDDVILNGDASLENVS